MENGAERGRFMNLYLLCSCTATRLQHLIEPQIARAFAPADLMPERRPEPRRAVGPSLPPRTLINKLGHLYSRTA